MINRDVIRERSNRMATQLAAALAGNDENAATEAIQNFNSGIAEMIQDEFNHYGNVTDMAVLQSRGLRTLTSEENQWYEQFIGAVKTGTKQAITNLTDAMPVTIIDRVIEDMKKSHPLLDALNIENAAGATKLVFNGVQMSAKLGSWGAITSAITTELSGAIKTIDLTTAKYTAYFPIPKDFVRFNFTFAPMWVDQYIRIILSETAANGLESAFVSGNGKNKPIGLAFDVSQATDGEYSEKTAIALTDWTDYPALIANNLLTDSNGDFRNVSEVLMVVNPKDYVKKIRPAQNALTASGVVDMINHHFPTRVVTSAFVSEGYAKIGIAANYFAAINGGKSGIIEYSDEYQFLDDVRVYTVREYAQGRPIDNVSFINVDISSIAPAYLVTKELSNF